MSDFGDGVCVCRHNDCRLKLVGSRGASRLFSCRWLGCNRRDMTSEQLKDHMEAKHVSKNTTGMICQWEGCECSGAWKKDYELKKHLNDKHHHFGYDCEWKDCQFTCCFSSQLMHHLEDHHIGKRNKQYKCEWRDCDYETKNKKRSELVSHISKHHNHIHLFCPRCNEGFCRQQDFTRHDKNFSDSPQDKSASKCVKSLPLKTPSARESYSDCDDAPQPPAKPTKTSGRKKQAPGSPQQEDLDASTNVKEEPYEEESTWLKEETTEYNDSTVKDEYDYDQEEDPEGAKEAQDAGDFSTILETLNIRDQQGNYNVGEAPYSSPSHHHHQHTTGTDYPSPRRSPSPSPHQQPPPQQQQWHNPFSSPSKMWGNGTSNQLSPSKFLSFSDTSSPSRHSDREGARSPTPHAQSPLNYPSPNPHAQSPANFPSPSPHTESNPPSPSPFPKNDQSSPQPSGQSFFSQSPSPLRFSGTSLSSPGLFHSNGYFPSFEFPGSSPQTPQFHFESSNAPSPSSYPDYASQHSSSKENGAEKHILPPISSLLNSLSEPLPPSPSPQHFSRGSSPFHQPPASPYHPPSSPAPLLSGVSPSPSGPLPPFSSLLDRPPESPGFLVSLSNIGSPQSPFNAHYHTLGDSEMNGM